MSPLMCLSMFNHTLLQYILLFLRSRQIVYIKLKMHAELLYLLIEELELHFRRYRVVSLVSRKMDSKVEGLY